MWRARHGGPRTPPRTTDEYLDCAFVENALFLHLSLTVKGQQNKIALVTRPDPSDEVKTERVSEAKEFLEDVGSCLFVPGASGNVALWS